MKVTRRSFMQVVSAISFIGIPAIPKYVKPINFKAFCGSGWALRLDEPFVQAGYKYATNAYCMVRQKCGQPDTILPDNKLAKYNYSPTAALPKNCSVFMAGCYGGNPVPIEMPTGHCENQPCEKCYTLENIIRQTCAYCNSTGKDFKRVEYFGREFGGAIIKTIVEELPNPMALGVTDDRMHFTFDGGEGVLMALLPLREMDEA